LKCIAAGKLKDAGALSIHAIVTHGVLSGNAVARLNASSLESIVVTNTIPVEEKMVFMHIR
jgi:ribose-phosphate pyrophosphokinase